MSASVTGCFQRFHVNVPVEYRLPSFSPRWEDYAHDSANFNKTIVMMDIANQVPVCVYSAAQLQLLWQAVFAQGIQHDVVASMERVDTKKFKVIMCVYNTLLYTYSRLDYFPAEEVPDIANLSKYWVVNDNKKCTIVPLCTIYPEGSRSPNPPYDYIAADKMPVDPNFMKIVARGYGIKGDLVDRMTDLAKIGDYFKAQNRYQADWEFNNVVFPPITIVSPEWYQHTLSGFARSRSPLAALNNMCEKFRIYNLHFNVTNTGNSTYSPMIRMGIFKASGIPVETSMNNVENNGAYNVQILAKGGDKFELYTNAGKEVHCNANTQEYAICESNSGYGYNLVVKTEIEFKNFFGNGNKTNEYQNQLLTVWTGNISYDVECMCLVPFLTQFAYDRNLKDMYLKTLLESADSSSKESEPAGAPSSTAHTGSGQQQEGTLIAKICKAKSARESKALGKRVVLRDSAESNELYPNIDNIAMGILSSRDAWPFQQALALDDVNEDNAIYKLMQSYYIDSGYSDNLTPLAASPSIQDAEVTVPICNLGCNCFGRRGVCVKPNDNTVKALTSEYTVSGTIPAGTSFTQVIGLDEYFAANTVQVNKDNLDNITQKISESSDKVMYTGQATIASPNPDGCDDVQDQGTPIQTQSQGQNGKIWEFIKKGITTVAGLFSKGDNRLMTKLYQGYAVNTFPNTIQPITEGRLASDSVKASFLNASINIPSDFTPMEGLTTNQLENWSEEFRDEIVNLHPKFLDIPFMLRIPADADLSSYTPGQLTITKSEVTNFNISLGCEITQGGALARSAQCPCDHFRSVTSNRCFAILSSVPFQSDDWNKVAVICSPDDERGFLVAPAPSILSQPSVANGVDPANIYGSIACGGNAYKIINNAMVTSFNDLSGSLPFFVPSTLPVISDGQVTFADTKEYVQAGNTIYVGVYNMTDISCTVKMGSDVNTSVQKMCMALWNYQRRDPAQAEDATIPIRHTAMPLIPLNASPSGSGWSNGRISSLTVSTTAQDLTILEKYFYLVCDKEHVPVTSNTPEAGSSNSVQSLKKAPKDAYAIQKHIEKKLPGHAKVQMMGV